MTNPSQSSGIVVPWGAVYYLLGIFGGASVATATCLAIFLDERWLWSVGALLFFVLWFVPFVRWARSSA